MIIQRDPLFGLLKLAPSPALRGLHSKQLMAMRGNHRFRAWLAGRRSGKSYAAAVWLLGGKSGQTSLYCARTLKSAKAIMLAVFAELNAKYHLHLDIRGSTGTITEPNGHVIQFCGLHDVGAVDLLRGFSKVRRVFIDEGGAFPVEAEGGLLRYAVETVLQPMLLDVRGDMCVAGTPAPAGPRGYFYELTGNPGLESPVAGRWPTSHWTFRDNPHIDSALVIEEALTANGWTEANSSWLREYEGIAIEDLESIVHFYTGERWAPIPGPGRTVLALDFGVVDQCAFIVGRQVYDQRPHVTILEAYSKSGMGMVEIAAKTRELREKWGVNKIVGDCGALGLGYANYLRDNHRIPIEKAEKAHKRSRIDDIRGRSDAGTLHFCEAASCITDEWSALCWNILHTDYHASHVQDLSDTLGYLLQQFSAWERPIVEDPVVTESELRKLQASQRVLSRKGLGAI